MANTASAKKMIRKIARRTHVNRLRRARMRSSLRRVEQALAAGDAAQAARVLRAAQVEVMRARRRGVIHKNTAARKISRLARRVNAL